MRCKHKAVAVWMVEIETYECVRCGAKGVRRLGKADEPTLDVSGGMFIASSQPLSGDWSMYRLDSGAIEIVIGGWGYSAAEPEAQAASLRAMEYEFTRAAEPDCRDEDDEVAVDPAMKFGELARLVTVPVHEVSPETLISCDTCESPFGCNDGACTEGKEDQRTPIAHQRDQSEVCSCTGDQLQAETCPEVES